MAIFKLAIIYFVLCKFPYLDTTPPFRQVTLALDPCVVDVKVKTMQQLFYLLAPSMIFLERAT